MDKARSMSIDGEVQGGSIGGGRGTDVIEEKPDEGDDKLQAREPGEGVKQGEDGGGWLKHQLEVVLRRFRSTDTGLVQPKPEEGEVGLGEGKSKTGWQDPEVLYSARDEDSPVTDEEFEKWKKKEGSRRVVVQHEPDLAIRSFEPDSDAQDNQPVEKQAPIWWSELDQQFEGLGDELKAALQDLKYGEAVAMIDRAQAQELKLTGKKVADEITRKRVEESLDQLRRNVQRVQQRHNEAMGAGGGGGAPEDGANIPVEEMLDLPDEAAEDYSEFEDKLEELINVGLVQGIQGDIERQMELVGERIGDLEQSMDDYLGFREMMDADLLEDMDSLMIELGNEVNEPELARLVGEKVKQAIGLQRRGAIERAHGVKGVDMGQVVDALQADKGGVVARRVDALRLVDEQINRLGVTGEADRVNHLKRLRQSLVARQDGKSLQEAGFDEMGSYEDFDGVARELANEFEGEGLQQVMDAVRADDGGAVARWVSAVEFLDERIQAAQGEEKGELQRIRLVVEKRQQGLSQDEADLIVYGKLRQLDQDRLKQVRLGLKGKDVVVVMDALKPYVKQDENGAYPDMEAALALIRAKISNPDKEDDVGVLQGIEQSLLDRRAELDRGLVMDYEPDDTGAMVRALEGLIRGDPRVKEAFKDKGEELAKMMVKAKSMMMDVLRSSGVKKYRNLLLYTIVAMLVIGVVVTGMVASSGGGHR